MAEEIATPAPADTVVTENGEATTQTMSYAGGKYKTVSELEKGYTELQASYSSKLGGFDGSPESYSLPDGMESNATLELMQKFGKENQLSQDGFNKFAESFNEHTKSQTEAKTKEIADFRASEIVKLGENANARIKNATDWVAANLGKEGIDVLNNLGGAEGITVVEKIMELTRSAPPANVPTQPSKTKDELKDMRFDKDENGNRRMSTDMEYRARVLKLEQESKG